MRLFPPPLEIDDNEGFLRDQLGRAEIGRGLSNLVATIVDPMVIALDGPWGTGKSTFLKMWAGDLRGAGFPVVYFDAFEHDYLDDAFLALAGEIVGLAQQKKRASDPRAKRFLARAVSAGKVVARSGAKVGVKALTLAAVSDDDFKEFAKALSDEAGQLTDKIVGEILSGHSKAKDELAAFRKALSDLPALLAEPAKDLSPEDRRPLIVIIDELDRCRPAFALELMERAKHFFSVSNVHFVLGANLRQLENSVVAAYGAGIDAQTYLQKFIHVTVNLEQRSRARQDRVTTKYIDYLKGSLDFPKNVGREIYAAFSIIEYIADRRDLSLRTIERIMTALAIGLAFTTERQLRTPPLVTGLAILKVLEPSLYAKARIGRLIFEEVRPVLGLDPDNDDQNMEWVTRWWRYACDPDCDKSIQVEMQSAMFKYNFGERTELLPYICEAVMDRFLPRE